MKLSDILSSFHQRWETCQPLTGSSKQITVRFKTGDVTSDLASRQAPAAHASRRDPPSSTQLRPGRRCPVPRASRSAPDGTKRFQPRHRPFAARGEAPPSPPKACLPLQGGHSLGNKTAVLCSTPNCPSCGASGPASVPAYPGVVPPEPPVPAAALCFSAVLRYAGLQRCFSKLIWALGIAWHQSQETGLSVALPELSCNTRRSSLRRQLCVP